VRNAYVLLVVLIGWVFFRAGTLDQATGYLGRMFGLNASGEGLLGAFDLVTAHSIVMIAVAFVIALPLWPRLRGAWQRTIDDRQRIGGLASAGYVAAVMLVSFAAMAGQENSPFLYFRF
jgi:alginate O-acetyltransferase complex protein AlgI